MAGGNTHHRGLACHIAPLSRSDGKQCQSKSGVWVGCSSFLLQMSSLLLFTTHYLWTCAVWEIMKGQVQSQKIPHIWPNLRDRKCPSTDHSHAAGHTPFTMIHPRQSAEKTSMTFPLRQRHVLAKANDGFQN